MAATRNSGSEPLPAPDRDPIHAVPSWAVGLCGVAAVASALFSILMFLNR
jgi:hypothetical protein